MESDELKRLLEQLRKTLDDGISNVELISGEVDNKREQLEQLETTCESVLQTLREKGSALEEVEDLLDDLQGLINDADDFGISV